MPRPKKPGVEPKRRSRNGCWPCKARKVKCGEEKPQCTNCVRQGETCDYSIRLNWGGRTKKDKSANVSDASSTASGSPYQTTLSFEDDFSPLFPPHMDPSAQPLSHVRSRSYISPPRSNNFMVDPELLAMSQSRTPPPLTSTAGSYDFHQSTMSMPASASYHQSQFQTTLDFSTMPTSTVDAFSYTSSSFPAMNLQAPPSPPSMPPPSSPFDTIHKRQSYNGYSMESPPTTMSEAHSPYTVGSEDPVFKTAPKHANSAYATPDLRRMSVQSIINNDFSEHSHHEHGRQYPIADFSTTTYGYDLGLPDLDTLNNDDFAAIAIFSPQADLMELEDESPYGSADPRSKDMAFGSGGYYAKPVPIRISKSLGTLPPLLMENPMNLLYFHHFINHTARMLVPHDCERNPFREILPEMAVSDQNIMHLLLAYSAAHRARMLNHPEPSNRIAVWVQDVFPKLRQTLIENPEHVSDNTLAAVIMMASLEIISSGAFEVPVSWQSHLTMARQMIIARGGPRGMGREDRVAYFLSRWFAYLDVLGSLSGNKNDMPLGSAYWSSQNATADEDFEIDCLMGFTTRCVGSLARISELAKLCEPQRIDDDGNVRSDWVPAPEIVQQAVLIRRQLEEGLLERNIRKGCNHRSCSATESEGAWDATEIYATNEMFHWAGLIHLYRRVLGKPAHDIEVQNAVREIVGLLYKIRRGSTAEACLMFPMFAAGCDTEDEGQREKIMERLRSVEGFGMTHTPRIAVLLQSVWDTGKPWESLVSGEFFG
ncbi:fungal-specific transcription factor domain-containing protein [Paraphoma chrysanthemicola]|uniref:Fungal-specific transcription factor domain-containing protein n=1 Tax=Paraphoma chrysanthemicola TaxID=798071 RepID=A0A8K0QXV4_9PLEO|nr:fungal-specific transcription factor domain-containing protein [Paraphoma chrysanthemicola]